MQNLRKLLGLVPSVSRSEPTVERVAARTILQNTFGTVVAGTTTADTSTDPCVVPATASQCEQFQHMTGLWANKITSNASQSDRCRTLWEITWNDVDLHPDIVDDFETWKEDPTIFLCSDRLKFPSTYQLYYDYTLSVCSAVVSNKILWRFLATTYYDAISAHHQAKKCSTSMPGVQFVVDVVCHSSSHDRGKVQENILRWMRQGKKYRAISDLVGGTWCYFFLPDIKENM